jgi:hypothetical protein
MYLDLTRSNSFPKLPNEELHNLSALSNTVTMSKFRTCEWDREKKREKYMQGFGRKTQRKLQLERPRHIWRVVLKGVLIEIGWEGLI